MFFWGTLVSFRNVHWHFFFAFEPSSSEKHKVANMRPEVGLCQYFFLRALNKPTFIKWNLTSSLSSYCSMSFLSFSASSMFSCRSFTLWELCCSICTSISFKVIWKWSMASFLCSSYSLHRCAFSSCHTTGATSFTFQNNEAEKVLIMRNFVQVKAHETALISDQKFLNTLNFPVFYWTSCSSMSDCEKKMKA